MTKPLIIHDVQEIGNKLKQERKTQKLRQTDIAVMAGIGTTPMQRVERGEGSPNISTLQLWAGALGYDVVILYCKGG